MRVKIHQIDAFSDRPFQGNPAAVCLLEESAADAWMQQVATEMNLSETAFLEPRGDEFQLRWFTPEVEVDLCGHATLASTHFLVQEGFLDVGSPVRFNTRSGVLSAVALEERIELDFPKEAPNEEAAPEGLLAALGVEAKWVGKNRFDYLVEVENEGALRALTPDFDRLAGVTDRGVMVTSRPETTNFDFVSRFFAPAVGINEDPVTGSAHCCLAPFWSDRLGKNDLTGYQASKRGGVVTTRIEGDRVILGGRAVTVMRGELVV